LTQNQYFYYDGIIFLDERVSNYFEELSLLRLGKSKYLIVLLDDRNNSLKEKNIIKAHLDELKLDVLMFTLWPEYLNIINKEFKY